MTEGWMDWFPQQYAYDFFLVTGLLGVLATLLLIIHTIIVWDRITRLSQRLRYYTLLFFAVLIATASYGLIADHQDVALRHLGALIGGVLLVVTGAVSLGADWTHHRKH